ncbi:uncharacterized protein LOC142644266 [Castanea sativa]|uniref:uncharacterized protein LOC142644266 n=1 Tax=Castanea sativa TaxID=21020 RepID=UPI003F650D64
MHRVLVDNGSLADILYYPVFQQMGIGRERLIPTNAPLVGFGGTRVYLLGVVTLPVTVRDYPQQITKDVAFLVVDCSFAYNAILGRPTLNAWKAITSTYHLMVKFPTEYRVGELRENQVAARECYVAMMEMDDHLQAMNIEEQRTVAELAEELEEENQDVFAWSHKDMPRINPSVMVHRLNVSPSFSPVRQKKRVFALERDRAIAVEIQKLQEADFILEVYVDDMLVKSIRESDHMSDLQETFNTLRSYKMKLNPSKCAFGVTAGKFLGFMVSQRGIEVYPEKVKAIMELSPPRTGAEETPIWRVHIDGSSNKHVGGVRVVLHTPEGGKIECIICPDFSTTNNEAEYEALVAGLDLAIAIGAKNVVVYSDSQIMTSQVNGSYDCKNERMKRYLEKVKGRVNNLQIKMV